LSRFLLSVIIPAYNEEARLLRTLSRLAEYYGAQDYSYEVIIVSDGSSDGTISISEAFCAEHAEFRVVDSQPNRGKGFVVRKGMLMAAGDYVLFCDADLATPQEETAKLLPFALDGVPVVIGSRPLKESSLEIRQPWYREMLGRTFNGVVQLLAIKGIADTQCGFKLFSKAACREIFTRCDVDGFGFDLECLLIARDLGYEIKEVPIRWMHQDGSKVNLVRDGLKMLRDLVQLRLKGKSGRTRVKVE
jgi:dolichyl-phosphate beta-glucosyltransferase